MSGTTYHEPVLFLSYRREDSQDVVGRIRDRLTKAFGERAIFRDVDSIEPGQDFRTVIGAAIRQCKVVLAIIGKTWLEFKDAAGQRRLDLPRDYVRTEIEEGLAHSYVIPVLVQGTNPPAEEKLPESIRLLAGKNAVWIRPDPDFHKDMDYLIAYLPKRLEGNAAGIAPSPDDRSIEIRIMAHSSLFFWWPIWVIALLFAAIGYWQDNRLAIVPARTLVSQMSATEFKLQIAADRVPATALEEAAKHAPASDELFLHRVHANGGLGSIFAFILAIVIFMTNVRLRSNRAYVIVFSIPVLSVLLSYLGWWGNLMETMSGFKIYMTADGYLFLGISLFVVWVGVVFFLDRFTYAVISPQQVRVRQDIGGEELTFSTTGMVIAKQRDDLFRHWILGQGSGDLVIRTAGANGREFVLPNVLFIARKVQCLEWMLHDRPVAIAG